jgi:D-psicose/D-tagatose/L-ribulose 3-epimerase
VGYVHIGESNRGSLGQGTINFPEVFGALVDMDYAGPITFESFSSAVVDPGLSNTLAVWRNLWTDGMDLATHAREFMSSGIELAQQASDSR